MKAELLIKYNKIFFDRGDLKYYNPRTVYNLIYHLDSLEEGNKKNQIETGLNQYLDFISLNPICNIEDCQTAYRMYLHPIIRYYVKKLGFISYENPRILIPIFLVLLFLVLFFFNSITTWALVCLFLILSFNYNYQKFKSKKTYGLTW